MKKTSIITAILIVIIIAIYYLLKPTRASASEVAVTDSQDGISDGSSDIQFDIGNDTESSISDEVLQDIGLEDSTLITLPPDTENLIEQFCSTYGVNSSLIKAQAYFESRGRQTAISKVGAIGVMQLMPTTATGLGVDPHDIVQNIMGGVKMMKNLLVKYSDNYAYALAAYNWGGGHVDKHIKAGDLDAVMPSETVNYIHHILGALGQSPSAYGVNV